MENIPTIAALLSASGAALAQAGAAVQGMAEYRAMRADGNPADLFAARQRRSVRRKRRLPAALGNRAPQHSDRDREPGACLVSHEPLPA